MWRRRTPPRRRNLAEAPVVRARRPDYAAAPSPADRVRRRLPRVSWRAVVATFALVTVLASGMVVLNSPLLEIRSVAVKGTDQLTADAIAQLSGLRGEHILLSNLGEARARILTQPQVQDVRIERVWPNGVRITVEERTPWAGWEADGQVWAIDETGVVLEGLAPPPDSVVVRQVSSLPAIRAGAHVDVEATELIRRLQDAGSPANGPRILGFEWALRTGLTVITQHGRVTFGGAGGFDFKYEVWEQLEREAQRRGEPLLAADLRFGTRPAVEIGLGLGRAVRILEP
jgi:cell division septal protein FtsQ